MKQKNEFVTISSLMLPRNIRKILALVLPFYLLLQFVGCLLVCAWEVAEHDKVSIASETEFCNSSDDTACIVENLPKLSTIERTARDIQLGPVPTAPTVRPSSPATDLGICPLSPHRAHFSPPIRRPRVLRI